MKSKKSILIISLISISIFALILTKLNLNQLTNKVNPEKINNKAVNSNTKKNGSVYGIDISHHQKKINWNKVKKWNNYKISFVYVKATEGASYIDKNYKQNIDGAIANNFLVGSYHYFRTTSSVEAQFKNFIRHVNKKQQNLIPMVDIEERKNWRDSEFDRKFLKFLKLIEYHFGTKPMIYTVNSFYNKHLSGKYKSYHFLIGRYGANPPNMRDKSNWSVWQFTEKGKVAGIPRYVDIDVINNKYCLDDFLLKK